MERSLKRKILLFWYWKHWKQVLLMMHCSCQVVIKTELNHKIIYMQNTIIWKVFLEHLSRVSVNKPNQFQSFLVSGFRFCDWFVLFPSCLIHQFVCLAFLQFSNTCSWYVISTPVPHLQSSPSVYIHSQFPFVLAVLENLILGFKTPLHLVLLVRSYFELFRLPKSWLGM